MVFHGVEHNGLEYFSSSNARGKRYHFRTETGKHRAYEYAKAAELRGQGIRRRNRLKKLIYRYY